MKASELMISDIVRLIYKVGTFISKVNIENLIDNRDGKMEYEPVPLTEEILKKNGFVHKDTMEEWWHEEYNPEWGIRMSDFELTDEFKFGRAKITYVHELQHALRLCGLNELADNFVI